MVTCQCWEDLHSFTTHSKAPGTNIMGNSSKRISYTDRRVNKEIFEH